MSPEELSESCERCIINIASFPALPPDCVSHHCPPHMPHPLPGKTTLKNYCFSSEQCIEFRTGSKREAKKLYQEWQFICPISICPINLNIIL